MADTLLTRGQVAAQLGLASKTLSKWACQGIGPRVVYLSKTVVRYRQADLDAWLASRDAGGAVQDTKAVPILHVLGTRR